MVEAVADTSIGVANREGQAMSARSVKARWLELTGMALPLALRAPVASCAESVEEETS